MNNFGKSLQAILMYLQTQLTNQSLQQIKYFPKLPTFAECVLRFCCFVIIAHLDVQINWYLCLQEYISTISGKHSWFFSRAFGSLLVDFYVDVAMSLFRPKCCVKNVMKTKLKSWRQVPPWIVILKEWEDILKDLDKEILDLIEKDDEIEGEI